MLEQNRSGDTSDGQSRAEEVLGDGPDSDLADLSLDETRRLVQELRARQVELEMQNHELRLFMDSSKEAFCLLDWDLNLVMANEATRAFEPGMSVDDAIGRNIQELAPRLGESGRYALRRGGRDGGAVLRG